MTQLKFDHDFQKTTYIGGIKLIEDADSISISLKDVPDEYKGGIAELIFICYDLKIKETLRHGCTKRTEIEILSSDRRLDFKFSPPITDLLAKTVIQQLATYFAAHNILSGSDLVKLNAALGLSGRSHQQGSDWKGFSRN